MLKAILTMLMLSSISIMAKEVVLNIDESIVRGQSIFQNIYQAHCRKQDPDMNGAKFAALHSQEEWEKIRDSGTIKNILMKKCKIPETLYNKKYQVDLSNFVYEYANDSGNVASCG